MLSLARGVHLLDVDNTLLDNDRLAADVSARLDGDFGKPERERCWSMHAELRDRLGYVDDLGALQAFRVGGDDDPALLQTPDADRQLSSATNVQEQP
ncbi:MAG: hypothetical protein IPI87_16555 [Betaproteobacteria bacterium]|nr:hypothetical protein [Betaproteobacteria bacterium]